MSARMPASSPRSRTTTTSPTKSIASSTSPFSLVSEAIVDQGGSLKTINNAGTIQASNTILTPDTGAVVVFPHHRHRSVGLHQRRHHRQQQRQDPGQHLPGLGQRQHPECRQYRRRRHHRQHQYRRSQYRTIPTASWPAPSWSNQAGFAPITNASAIDFGSGADHVLHVGGFGYVNAVINSNTSSLAVQVDPNGQLFVANTTSALQASTFNIASNGTLGLAISQTNLNSLTPVVQANSASLSGANLGLQFGTYISSGFTAASDDQSHHPDHHPDPGAGDHRHDAGRPECPARARTRPSCSRPPPKAASRR